jgi:acyl-homoserine lactone acylase PvdQ
VLRLPGVHSVREAQSLLQHVDLPGNWLIADNSNNIGYQQSGLSPIRRTGYTGLHPGLRWRHDWVNGMYPSHKLRTSFNPPEGYIVTASMLWSSFKMVVFVFDFALLLVQTMSSINPINLLQHFTLVHFRAVLRVLSD